MSVRSRYHYATWANTLARSAFASMTVRLFGMLLTLVAHIVLARWMDASAYGQYNFAMTVCTVFAVVALCGLDQGVLLFLPRYALTGPTHLIRDYLWYSLKVGVVVGGMLAALLAGVFSVSRIVSMTTAGVWWTALVLPTAGLLLLQQVFRALKSFRLAQAFEQTILPICLLVGAMALYSIGQLTFRSIVAWHGIVAGIGCVVLAVRAFKLVKRDSLPQPPIDSAAVRIEWLKVGVPLAAANLMSLLLARADILILGVFRSAPELATYSVASRLSGVLILGLYAADMVVAPYISELYARGDFQRLARTYWIGVLMAVAIAVPGALILFALPELALGLFGEHFATESTILFLLVLARLVQAMFGPIGLLLTVTGYQNKYLAVVSVVSVGQTVALFVSAKLYGSVGTAVTVCVGTLAWSGMLFVMAMLLFPWFPFGRGTHRS